MEVTSQDKKSFQLTEHTQLLGELIYEHMFYVNAQIRLSDSEIYQIAIVGVFGTSIIVIHEGKEVARLVLTWKGQIVITWENGEEFILKMTGLFNSKYILENSNQEKLLVLEPNFSWLQSHFQYQISYDSSNREKSDILLVLISLYAANYFVATLSGANSGMMY